MPVHCELKVEKWRIVDSSGAIEKTERGNPVDGGGHPSREACLKQQAAINRALSAVVMDEEMPDDTWFFDEDLDEDWNLAVWGGKQRNDLPDSSFLYVEPGGTKDETGRTVPRSKRHFPYKNAAGKIDLPHLRNAIARIPQSNIPASLKQRLQAKARRILEGMKGAAASIVNYQDSYSLAVSSESDEVQRFKKDIIREGVYKHPVQKWVLNVTRERLNRWLVSFKEMKKNGIDVEVPLDHSFSAEKNTGYMVDAMLEPDSEGKLHMFGILEIRGTHNIGLVRSNKNVSVWIEQDYVDGEQRHYGEVIRHCAIVQQPIVGNQGDFQPIAASMVNEVQIFSQRSNDMPLLEDLKKLFGLEAELEEEKVLSQIKSNIEEKDTKIADLEKDNLTLKAQVPGKAASQLSPDVLELAGSAISEKIDTLIQNGKVSPDVGKKLSAVLAGETGKRNAYTLSLGENASQSLASQIVEILAENKVTDLKERTGLQMLSNTAANEQKADEASGEAMAVGAGVENDAKK